MKPRKSTDGANKHKAIILYAEPKVGKTKWSDTMPSPILRINAVVEYDGEESLPADSESISLDIDSYADLYMVTVALCAAYGIDYKLSADEDKIVRADIDADATKKLAEQIKKMKLTSVVWDSFVALQGYMKVHSLEHNPKAGNGFELWGDVLSMTQYHLNRWMRLPLHKCFTTLVDHTRDEETGKEIHFPLFLGKATYKIFPPMVSVIARLVKGKEEWEPNHDRYVQIATANNYVCGARGAGVDTPDLLPANLSMMLETLYDIKGENNS